jgi:hypothetical protein
MIAEANIDTLLNNAELLLQFYAEPVTANIDIRN